MNNFRTGLFVGLGYFLFALCIIPGLVSAQLPSSVAGRVPGASADLGSMFGKSSSLELPSTGAFFEGAVDSTEYIVGPGDVFRVVYWKPTYNEVISRVSAEGDLSIPLVGLVRVADLSLVDAKRRVAEAVDRSFRYGDVGLSLIEPRKFRVHVTGMVAMPGTYVVSATARVADALELAGGLLFEYRKSGTDSIKTLTGSARNIELRDRIGKAVAHADLLLFQLGGVSTANPVLRDGWSIYVPTHPASNAMISVTGAVGSPGEIEHAAGDRIQQLIAVAGGFTSDADRSKVAVVHRSGERKMLNLDQATSADWQMVIVLGDRILVGAVPDSSNTGSVTIEGEVNLPGGYAIQNGQTTVAELLSMAGGMTGRAVARSARLIRNPKYDAVRPEMARIITGGARDLVSGPVFLDEMLYAEFMRWDYGTVVMDLSSVEESQRLVLYDGDRLEIPRTPLGVRVLGSVQNAGEVSWHDEWKLSDYLLAAGGKSRGAYLQHAIVVRAKNGAQVRYSKNLAIDPGDLIYVPQRPFDVSAWTTFKDFIAVAAQVATVVLVVQQAVK